MKRVSYFLTIIIPDANRQSNSCWRVGCGRLGDKIEPDVYHTSFRAPSQMMEDSSTT